MLANDKVSVDCLLLRDFLSLSGRGSSELYIGLVLRFLEGQYNRLNESRIFFPRSQLNEEGAITSITALPIQSHTTRNHLNIFTCRAQAGEWRLVRKMQKRYMYECWSALVWNQISLTHKPSPFLAKIIYYKLIITAYVFRN